MNIDADILIYGGSVIVAFVAGLVSKRYRQKPTVDRLLTDGFLSEHNINALRQQLAVAELSGHFDPIVAGNFYKFLRKIDDERGNVDADPNPEIPLV